MAEVQPIAPKKGWKDCQMHVETIDIDRVGANILTGGSKEVDLRHRQGYLEEMRLALFLQQRSMPRNRVIEMIEELSMLEEPNSQQQRSCHLPKIRGHLDFSVLLKPANTRSNLSRALNSF